MFNKTQIKAIADRIHDTAAHEVEGGGDRWHYDNLARDFAWMLFPTCDGETFTGDAAEFLTACGVVEEEE